MAKKTKAFNKIFAIIFTVMVFIFGAVAAYAANIKNGQTVEKNKTWEIHFNEEIKFHEEIDKNIKVLDYNNKEIDLILKLGQDKKSIIVSPKDGSYELGESYTLVIDEDVISKNNKKLEKEVTMDFNIKKYDRETIMDKVIDLPEEEYNEAEAEKMINRLKKIPYPILEELLKNDIEIILSNSNITEVEEYAYLNGVIPRGWEGTGKTWDDVPGAGGKPVVARIGYSEPGEAHGAINLELHETAHAIDAYVFNDISFSDEYKVIWKDEVQRLFGNDPYFINYPEEYFAETFAMYYVNEEQNKILKERAPLTYEFIKNLENRIEGVVSANANYSYFLANVKRQPLNILNIFILRN